MRRSLKTLLITLVALVCAMLFMFTAFANSLGDVDNDGKVTAGDARLALRAAVGLESYAEGSAEFKAADADHDNKLTASDARLILRAAVGLEDLSGDCDHVWETYPNAAGTAVFNWKTEKTQKGVPAGYHSRTCTKCGTVEIGDCTYGEKLPQNDKKPGPATCTESFTWYQRCTLCNGARVGTDYALNHAGKVLDASKSVGATCTTPGYDWYECPLCGENGDTLAELKVDIPALGHNVSADSISGDQDIVCTRCGKTVMPSFNTLVNAIKSEDKVYFSSISKQESRGTVLDSNIKISATAKALMAMLGESISEEEIIQGFTEELDKPDAEYSDYRWQSPLLYQYYPLSYSTEVSRLTAADIKSITVQDVDTIDFINEVPDSVLLRINSQTSRTQDLTEFKALGNTTGTIQKVTVEVIDEKYSQVKDSAEETALMRATGIDIRAYSDMFNQNSSEDGFEITMTCKDIVSKCAITYYFLVTQEGDDTVYTPLASKYFTDIDIDQHISMIAAFAITEGGNPVEILSGTIDLKVINTNTDYYIFSPRS